MELPTKRSSGEPAVLSAVEQQDENDREAEKREEKVLLVNASAGQSELHGIGLIAREFIPCGTKIWKLNPNFDRVISEEELQSLPPVAQRQVKYYAYYCLKLNKYVLSSDDDRFTNHSDTPNTKDCGEYSIAVKDIHPGEEITADYIEIGITEYKGNGLVAV